MSRRIGLALVALCVAATAVLALAGWPGRLYRDSDYVQYYAGSRALLEGQSPYDHAWWTEFHRRIGSEALSAPPHTGDAASDWTTPYPLWTFVALLPFAVFPLSVAEPLFATVQVVLVVAATLALGAVFLARPRRDAPMAVALVLASQPLWVLVAGGNVTGFATAAFTFALATLLAGRPRLAGLALAGCLIKPHLFALGAVVLVAAMPAAQRARFVTGALAGALVLIVPAFIAQPGWVGDWLREAGRLQSSSASNATGWTIARVFTTDFGPLSVLVVIACAAAFALWWWRVRPALPILVAGAMPVSVLVAPHGWSYDYIALVPTVVAGVALASAARLRTLALAFVALVAVVVPWVLYIVAFRRNGEDLSALLLIAVEAAVIVSVRRRA
jgi:hypothetical protein